MAIKVLFVCLGNICRSPTAEAVFRSRVSELLEISQLVEIDSAGTAGWHSGSAPDPRSLQIGATRGYDLESLRARQVKAGDFDQFDYILAMDQQNLTDLEAIRPAHFSGHLGLFLDFADSSKREVPDPYYTSGDQGFHEVIDLIESASDGLIVRIKDQLV